jgi:pimeloyl-ACP methyl ester carboxylesterase
MSNIEPNSPHKDNFISANGIDMYYEDHGPGPALLLLHGGTGSSKGWEGYFGTFFEGFRVIAPDLRRHGRTNNPSGEWSYSIMADDVAAFVDEMDLHKPHICGWSDGGQIGLDLAIRYPDLASSYIIGGAWKDISETDFGSLMELGFLGPGDVNFKQLEEVAPEFLERVSSFHSSQGTEYWKDLLIGISKLWFTPFKYDNDALISIQNPILFIIGAKDQFISVETAVAMYRLLPNSDLAVVPNADHFFPFTNAKYFSDPILEFLGRHST